MDCQKEILMFNQFRGRQSLSILLSGVTENSRPQVIDLLPLLDISWEIAVTRILMKIDLGNY